jgi:hypothetical protein
MTDDHERQIEELTAKLASLTERKAAVEKRVRDLMAAEDCRAGITFAKEIFEAQQEKLVLTTEMDITRRRRKRLTMDI